MIAFAALAAALALMMALAIRPARVDASGTIPWGGHGAENLPCESGAHWVLAPADGVTAATLSVDGTTYVMTPSGNGSWSADSGPVTADSEVFVTFEGPGDPKNHLQLSHCLGTVGQALNDVSLTTVDQNGDALADVAYMLTGVTDASVSESGSTDANGQLSFSGLAAGTYSLAETAPEGCTGVADFTVSLAADGSITFPAGHVGVSLDADGTLVVVNTCTEGGAGGSGAGGGGAGGAAGGSSPEANVKGVTGGPSAGLPNTASDARDTASDAGLIAALILLAGLWALGYANTRSARRRQ